LKHAREKVKNSIGPRSKESACISDDIKHDCPRDAKRNEQLHKLVLLIFVVAFEDVGELCRDVGD